MNFCLLINASSPWRQSVDNALSLASSMSSNGHQVNTVFFYGQAINIVNCQTRIQAWHSWQQHSHAKLQVCSTLIEQQQLTSEANQAQCFEVVGLSSWVSALESTDKMVELN